MASLRIEDKTFQDRARGRQGRAADARREPAVRPAAGNHQRPGVHGSSLQASGDRQHGGSRGRVDRRRARLLPDLLRAEQRDRGARRRLRYEGGAGARHAVSRARAEVRPAGAARHSEGAAADERAARARWRKRGRCRPSSSRTTSRTTATRIRIRCTSRRRSCRTARARASTASWSTRRGIALAAFGGGNIIEDPNLFFAVAIVQPGHTPEEAANALIAELDRLRDRAGHGSELQQAKNQFARDYILGRESDQGQGEVARPRRRDPQRHQDGRRRVRHLPEHHAGRRAARRAKRTSRRRTGSCSRSCRSAAPQPEEPR